ncbi:uncharacterized protein LOC121177363 [Toxotes jaculatrix]|uniref:uncharacterized protein LOC121177363 n=1 Tax=Toxotes jaculatrix TaxID=941984 RepID=UPI001B3AC4D6|nr:uncharacterized protein LOC121177363 [Toxotes jaculatrix]
MKLAGLTCLWSWCVQLLSTFLCSVTGKPLQPVPPGQIIAVVGDDVVLPCGLRTSVSPSHVVEWSRANGTSRLTVHVFRNGRELIKEKSAEYRGRTDVMEDGSLNLQNVTRWDSGTYRCVLLPRSSTTDEVFVSLFVAELSEVTVTLQHISSNELLVHCESSGWSPELLISLLDASGNVLAAQRESAGPDHLCSVRVHLAAAEGKLRGTLICRVEAPGTRLVKEETISVHAQIHPLEAGHTLWVVAVIVVAAIVFAVVRAGRCLLCDSGYGDVLKVETTGASEDIARANHLLINGRLLAGVEASSALAQRDLSELMTHREMIVRVGQSRRIQPALIAAIISRQSQAGTKLDANGFGQFDPDCFGLMQINKRYHPVTGGPYSGEHVEQGVDFLIQLIRIMKRKNPKWTSEQQLKGALACYIAGEDIVLPLAYEDVDSVTPYRDFANDVVARAQWFSDHGF